VEVAWDAEVEKSPALSRAEDPAADAEAAAHRGQVLAVLERAMAQLDPEDRMIARMHVQDGYTLADVARALGLEPKPLYRRLHRIFKWLRGYLEANGVGRSDVQDVLWEKEDG
jgi:RNA polymerase sigma factor for flagellar operon FliA